MYNHVTFNTLIGKTLVSASRTAEYGEDQLNFVCDDGTKYAMCHSQNCCESVSIEDIEGDLNDLLDSRVLVAEESTNSGDPPSSSEYPPESYTWTFFRIATTKGWVTIRWYGTSNGYYSETAYLYEVTDED